MANHTEDEEKIGSDEDLEKAENESREKNPTKEELIKAYLEDKKDELEEEKQEIEKSKEHTIIKIKRYSK